MAGRSIGPSNRSAVRAVATFNGPGSAGGAKGGRLVAPPFD